MGRGEGGENKRDGKENVNHYEGYKADKDKAKKRDEKKR